MRYLRLLAVLGICLIPAGAAQAQRVVVGVGIGAPVYYGPPPVCAYGYYPYSPYACVPYGYYGPEWFVNGVFIGAGPWFHGFYGRPVFRGHRDFDDWHSFDRGFRRDFDDHDRGWGDRGRSERRFHGGRDFHGGSSRGGGGFHGGGRSHGGGGFHGHGHR